MLKTNTVAWGLFVDWLKHKIKSMADFFLAVRGLFTGKVTVLKG